MIKFITAICLFVLYNILITNLFAITTTEKGEERYEQTTHFFKSWSV